MRHDGPRYDPVVGDLVSFSAGDPKDEVSFRHECVNGKSEYSPCSKARGGDVFVVLGAHVPRDRDDVDVQLLSMRTGGVGWIFADYVERVL